MSMPYHTGGTLTLTIGNVLYVPELGLNFLSCSRLAAKGIATVFHDRGCDLIDRNDDEYVVFTAVLRDELCRILNVTPKIAQEYMQHAGVNTEDVNSGHHRLGHVNKDKIASMLRNNQLSSIRNESHSDPCLDCSSGKQTRGLFKGHIDKATKPGEVMHFDVVGRSLNHSPKASAFVSFIDEWTRYTTVTPIRRKNEVYMCFK
jgi:GAG-pre-integrase domain